MAEIHKELYFEIHKELYFEYIYTQHFLHRPLKKLNTIKIQHSKKKYKNVCTHHSLHTIPAPFAVSMNTSPSAQGCTEA